MQFEPIFESASSKVASQLEPGWRRVKIRQIEDLDEAVPAAGLRALQLSRQPVTGSLVFAGGDDVALSSGYLRGRVSLAGALPQRHITIGLGLDFAAGVRHWLREVGTGCVGLAQPGGEHDAIYADGSLYLKVTLSEERLLAEAEHEGLALDAAVIRQSGVHPRSLSPAALDRLRRWAVAAHRGAIADGETLERFRTQALVAVVQHLGRSPHVAPGLPSIGGHERIVARARAWIDAHLGEAIGINDIAAAAGASRRTLTRAFFDVLEESPRAHVTRLRLHRIRSDLVARAVAAPRIAEASNRWGVGEVGRMSGRYKAMFGELPSETARVGRTRARFRASDDWAAGRQPLTEAPHTWVTTESIVEPAQKVSSLRRPSGREAQPAFARDDRGRLGECGRGSSD